MTSRPVILEVRNWARSEDQKWYRTSRNKNGSGLVSFKSHAVNPQNSLDIHWAAAQTSPVSSAGIAVNTASFLVQTHRVHVTVTQKICPLDGQCQTRNIMYMYKTRVTKTHNAVVKEYMWSKAAAIKQRYTCTPTILRLFCTRGRGVGSDFKVIRP